MVKPQKSINTELQINMASTRVKRMEAETSTSTCRDKKKSKEDDEILYILNLEVIQFVTTNEEKNEIYASRLFHKKQTTNEFGAVEDHNPKENGVDFDTFINENIGYGGTDFGVPFEDVIGSRAEDVNVGREVPFEDVIGLHVEDVEVGREDVDADDDYILVDDNIPNIPSKRLRKAAVFR
ncbi:Uncharacterized protein Adt_04391 [Abeliophyllum distichum]|uniref:Uncharacterized protein n=1 Tax=Abeliophyllum distichum TaxID=126358 RepID=A0ABD1W3B9_9LAMI